MKLLSKIEIIFVLLILLTVPLRANAATVPLEEAPVPYAASLATVHYGVDGHVYVVDEGAGILSRIDPTDNTYEQFFPAGSGALMDGLPDSAGKIWWTDGADTFGYFDTLTDPNDLAFWTLPEDGLGNQPNVGPLTALDGQVWLASWAQPMFGLYRFNPAVTSDNLCHYVIPGGSYATSLVAQGGRLWWLNWFSDSLMSLTYPGGELVKYELGRNVNADAGMLVDGNLLWWTEDAVNGKVARFDTQSHAMTLFDLPSGAHPVKVEQLGGGIWYTDASGALGRINPQSAVSNPPVELTPSLPMAIPASCQTLAAPTILDGSPLTGVLSWSTANATLDQPQAGLDVYSLPATAEPVGLAAAGNSLWLSDAGRGKLVRLDVVVEKKVFIPMVRK